MTEVRFGSRGSPVAFPGCPAGPESLRGVALPFNYRRGATDGRPEEEDFQSEGP